MIAFSNKSFELFASALNCSAVKRSNGEWMAYTARPNGHSSHGPYKTKTAAIYGAVYYRLWRDFRIKLTRKPRGQK